MIAIIPRRIMPPPIPKTAEMEEVIKAAVMRIMASIIYPSPCLSLVRGEFFLTFFKN
ncbi:MAG: hypothetical protein H8E85_04870 [Candidatus Marinimicrobia bacterium]|nr:hypothetical protein [Candidatus Neomarinimicrobiota bacterium]